MVGSILRLLFMGVLGAVGRRLRLFDRADDFVCEWISDLIVGLVTVLLVCLAWVPSLLDGLFGLCEQQERVCEVQERCL